MKVYIIGNSSYDSEGDDRYFVPIRVYKSKNDAEDEQTRLEKLQTAQDAAVSEYHKRKGVAVYDRAKEESGFAGQIPWDDLSTPVYKLYRNLVRTYLISYKEPWPNYIGNEDGRNLQIKEFEVQ